ncbi:autotransporter domain-containing protein [Roseibium sp.]|uniref:autotransporter family protein n=1 Tax=Roseibium sp. TaxID=1936156 RepID=UPI003BAC0BA4
MKKFSRQLLLTIFSAGALVLALASHALSQDLIIDGPVTNTQTVDSITYDTIVITGDGSISTTGNNNHGVSSTGGGNTVRNQGLILTEGDYAFGIYSTGANATITNSGDILTTGVDAYGILNIGSDATIINSGDIRTFADSAGGISNIGSDATIINSGDIRTFADSAGGISNIGSDATIINSGDIRTFGDSARGIYNWGNITTIINSGDIRTSGQDAISIYIYSSDYTKITNSGVIVSEKSHAIFVDSFSTSTTVNLNVPSFLGGAITFDSETTLNLTTGASHSVLWQLPTTNVAGGQANVSGPVPWFYDSTTGQFATFDPTGLTASFNQMANTANMLGRLGRYGLRQAGRGGSAGAPSSALAYGEDGTQTPESFDQLLATNSGPKAAYGLRTGSFWLTGFGGEANYDGDDTTLDHTIDQIGAALGYAWNQSPDMRLGFMAGYMNGSITAKSTWADSQDITSNGVFAGVHGDRRFGRLTFGLGLAGGWQTNDSSRFVNDNTALTGGLTLGESTADASYDSWFVTPEASLSADIGLGRTGIVLTPSIRGRYALQQTGSYTESGSAANATVDSHTFGVVEGDFELALSRSFGIATVTGRAGYLLRSSTGDDNVPVTLLGITNSIGLGETGRSAAYLGASMDLNLGPQASFTLDGQGYLSDDIDALEGMARFAIRF